MGEILKRITVDATQCSGCRYCEMVCSYRHEGKFRPTHSRVAVIREDKYGMDYPVLCRQCEPCQAIDACPSGALKQSVDGVVRVDHDMCTSCGVCAGACPYDAIKLDGSSKALLCDHCGGQSACVKRCPTKALIYGESEFISEHPEEVFQDLKRRWGIGG
jgi:Fe-S-cluster-containing hydrogenase component 2